MEKNSELKENVGSHEHGEIELILDPETIATIEKIQEEKWLKKGYPPEEARKSSQIGVIHSDPYWTWVRDAVLFPSGVYGTYNRIIHQSSLTDKGPAGAIILPVTETGEIVLIANYRHATRDWEIELPKGAREQGETALEAAKRETLEETGYDTLSITKLGDVTLNSGVVAGVAPLFFAKVSALGLPHQDDSEAILSPVVLPLDQVEMILEEGKIEISRNGKKVQAFVRDADLALALFLAKRQGLL